MSNVIDFPIKLDRRTKRTDRITFRVSADMKWALVDRARELETTVGKLIVDLAYHFLQSETSPIKVRRRRAA